MKELFEKIIAQVNAADYLNRLCVDCFMTIDVMAKNHSYAISGKVAEIYDEAGDIEDYGYEFYVDDNRDDIYETLHDAIEYIVDKEMENTANETI